jgi:uncharacterized protein (TIGR00255 family)
MVDKLCFDHHNELQGKIMISSMTGYGRAESVTAEAKVVVEITSVNNRYSEIQTRLPRFLISLESKIKEQILSSVSRGKINYSLTWEDLVPPVDQIKLNFETARIYCNLFNQLKKEFKLKGELELEDFVALPDIIKMEREELHQEKVWPIVSEVTQKALSDLNRMRQTEGKSLALELEKMMSGLSSKVDEIEKYSQQSLTQYQEKLRAKIRLLQSEVMLDETRIAQEVALMADKIDVTEECARFRSHQAQFLQTLKENSAVGKRLGFILQELNREANTIGAKAIEYEISARVISIKEELEKIREQIQNLE